MMRNKNSDILEVLRGCDDVFYGNLYDVIGCGWRSGWLDVRVKRRGGSRVFRV